MSDLNREYTERYCTALQPLASAIEKQLHDYFSEELRIDRISVRPKSVDRFLEKAAAITDDGEPKYSEPLRQIQDQVGARIITFYHSDIERLSDIVWKYFRPVEAREVVPDSEWEFGYFGTHFVLLTPKGLIDSSIAAPEFFELQIKTLFQHAWSEANHDLGYKTGGRPLEGDEKRRLAFTSAQAWGADRLFDELFQARKN